MRIISIDVGIKNLAFCLFSLNEDKTYEIENWGVVDLSQKTEIQRKCNCFNEKKPTKKIPFPPKEKCNFQAKWKRENTYYCVKHAKQSPFLIPTNEFKSTYINKQNISSLKKIMDKLEIKYDNLNLPTVLTKNEPDLQPIFTNTPKKGEGVLFDGLYYHSGNSPVKYKGRCVINFDFTVHE